MELSRFELSCILMRASTKNDLSCQLAVTYIGLLQQSSLSKSFLLKPTQSCLILTLNGIFVSSIKPRLVGPLWKIKTEHACFPKSDIKLLLLH